MLKRISAAVLIAVFAMSTSAQHTDQHTARGILVSVNKATLSSELAARVVALPKRMGESFLQGDTLIKLDCSLFKAQLEKVDAEGKIAQSKLDSAKLLNKLNSIGTLEVTIAQADLQKASAERTMAKLNVERCDIKAPFDGAVEQLDINVFEVVQQHQEIIKVIGQKDLEADIIVPAQWMNWLTKNQAITLTVEEINQKLRATIQYIGPSVDPTSQTLQIRATIEDMSETVLSGMSVVALFRNETLID